MEFVDYINGSITIKSEKSEIMEFGTRLEYLRKRAGWSRAEVAHRIKLSPSTVTKHEYGEREPNLTTLKAYAMLYGVSIDFLLGLSDDPEIKPAAFLQGLAEAENESLATKNQNWLTEQDINDLRKLLRKMRKSGVYSANW